MFLSAQEHVCLLGGTQLQEVEQLYCYKRVGVHAPDVFAVERILPILKKKLLLIHFPVWLHLVIR
jgi:hypothetical protein